MERIKIDRYRVCEKGREYTVLVFPFVKHMWAFDDYPEEDCLMIDGCAAAFKLLSYAFAILANEPDKLIYFPSKQEGIGRYYKENYDAVLGRPELQFRRSLWPRIRRKLNKQHWQGHYRHSYDKKKLNDCFENLIMKKYDPSWMHVPRYDRQEKFHVEEILGDTAFWVLTRPECYEYHYHTTKDLEEIGNSSDYMEWSSIGYIFSEQTIGRMYSDMREEEERQKQKEMKGENTDD